MHTKQTCSLYNIHNSTYASLASFHCLSLFLLHKSYMQAAIYTHACILIHTHPLLLFASLLSGLEERFKSREVLTEQCAYTMHVHVYTNAHKEMHTYPHVPTHTHTHTHQSQSLLYFLVIPHLCDSLSKASLLTCSRAVYKDVFHSLFSSFLWHSEEGFTYFFRVLNSARIYRIL